jgi:hypothetical protein
VHNNLLDRWEEVKTLDWVMTIDEYNQNGDILRQIIRYQKAQELIPLDTVLHWL